MSTNDANTSFIFRFCHHMRRRSARPVRWKLSAWNRRFSVLSTSSSIFSPRSSTFSMLSIMISFTSLTCCCTRATFECSPASLDAASMCCFRTGANERLSECAIASRARSPYDAANSAAIRSRTEKGTCLPNASSATTRNTKPSLSR